MSTPMQHADVVGGGVMGVGIAEVCARSGLDVVLVETDSARADAAREPIGRSLEKAVSRGKTEATVAAAALDRLVTTTDMAGLADRHILVEAVVEDEPTKLEVFRRLAQIVEREDAVLSSNTSSIPIVELANATNGRAAHILGLQFFNPVPVLKLVEIIPSLLTGPETVECATAFVVEQLGQGSDHRSRPCRLHSQRVACSIRAVGDPHARTGDGDRRGRRQGDGRTLRTSDGATRFSRPHWARHRDGYSRDPSRGAPRAALCAPAPAPAARRGGTARPKDRTWLLQP